MMKALDYGSLTKIGIHESVLISESAERLVRKGIHITKGESTLEKLGRQ